MSRAADHYGGRFLGGMLLILLLAAGLRLYHIDTQSLWHDEGNSLRQTERSVDDLLAATQRDIHPPGYYLILKGWVSMTGRTELGLRSLSALWGVLAVAGTAALGRGLFGRRAGLLAAGLMALHPFAIYYSQEARMYAQLAAVSVLSLWAFTVMVGRVDRRLTYLRSRNRPHENTLYVAGWAYLLAGLNALGLYTQYTFPATLAVQLSLFGWWYVRQRDDRLRVTFIALNVLTLMLFVPWLFTAYEQVTTWPATGDATPLLERLAQVFRVLVYGETVEQLTVGLAALPLLLMIAALWPWRGAGLPGESGTQSYAWRMALPVGLVALSMGALLFSGAYRPANFKFLLPAQSALALILAAGAVRLGDWPLGAERPGLQRGLAVVGLGLVLGVGLVNAGNLDRLYFDGELARSDYRGIAETIQRTSQPGDAVILTAPNQQEVFSYYYDGPLAVYPLPHGLGGDDAATRAATQAVIDRHRRIFLVLWGQAERDPNNVVEDTLRSDAFFLSHRWYNDVQLVQFASLGDAPDTPQQALDIVFQLPDSDGTSLRLRGYTLSETRFQTGVTDVLGVTLYWSGATSLDRPYKVSVQLLHPDGRLAVQGQDSTLQPGEDAPQDRQAIVLDANLPPGTYTLIASVYDPAEPLLRLVPSEGEHSDNAVFLAEIEIK